MLKVLKNQNVKSVFVFCQKRFNSNQSYFHNIGNEPLTYRTIGEQLSISAEKYKNREFAITNHEKGLSRYRMTYTEVKERADQLAAGFIELGLKRGDRIGIWAPNCSSWYVTMFAAARLGLVTCALDPEYKAREVEYCLKKANVKILVTADGYGFQNYYKSLREIFPELDSSKIGELNSKSVPSLKSVIVDSEKKYRGTIPYDEVLSLAQQSTIQEINANQSDIKPDAISNMKFTSGTTGLPKALNLTHFSIINNAIEIGKRSELNLKPHIVLAQIPFYHSFGHVIQLISSLIYGATIIMPDKTFNPINTLKAIEKRKCTLMFGTPTMFNEMIRTVKESNKQFGVSWETAVVGGACTSPKLLEELRQKFRLKSVFSMYGLTEATAVIFQTQSSDNQYRQLNTVGKVHDHLEVKVIDRAGKIVPFGEPGELCVRGYPTMVEYYREEDKTKEIMDESKWLRTGDKFVLTKDGYGRIVGRVRDTINRGGEYLVPKEIEDYLGTHPDIVEAYVVGVPDERMGEEICAYIQLMPGKTMILEDVQKFCELKLEKNQIPQYLRVVESLPKTTSGKIQKFKLRELFRTSISF